MSTGNGANSGAFGRMGLFTLLNAASPREISRPPLSWAPSCCVATAIGPPEAPKKLPNALRLGFASGNLSNQFAATVWQVNEPMQEIVSSRGNLAMNNGHHTNPGIRR